MQTLSRYYSNTFSDTEKQNAINLFLGVYVPRNITTPIWELSSDYILHHSLTRGIRPCHSRSTSQWWDAERPGRLALLMPVTPFELKVDLYLDHHRPYEFCILSELFSHLKSHSVRDYMPHFTTDESPFSVRRQPGKRQEELSRSQSTSPAIKNPGMTGQASTSSTISSGTSSTESEAGDEDELSVVSSMSEDEEDSNPSLSLTSFFPPMTETYGNYLQEPSRVDSIIYKRYEQIYCATGAPEGKTAAATAPLVLIQRSSFCLDSSVETDPLTVTHRCRNIYEEHVMMAVRGPQPPDNRYDPLARKDHAAEVGVEAEVSEEAIKIDPCLNCPHPLPPQGLEADA
ncbi:hypothetical protein O3P69_007227 [Scylla paramamosain]|uniref:Uncharacterized protein n=1 Tax=Scylla paramamosain TaxID=85552 RepID=A0AAW0V2C6_SCYPA